MVNDDTIKTGQSLSVSFAFFVGREKKRDDVSLFYKFNFSLSFSNPRRRFDGGRHEKKTKGKEKKKSESIAALPLATSKESNAHLFTLFRFHVHKLMHCFFLERERANRVSRWSQTRVDS